MAGVCDGGEALCLEDPQPERAVVVKAVLGSHVRVGAPRILGVTVVGIGMFTGGLGF